jgi:hypothetical protein
MNNPHQPRQGQAIEARALHMAEGIVDMFRGQPPNATISFPAEAR